MQFLAAVAFAISDLPPSSTDNVRMLVASSYTLAMLPAASTLKGPLESCQRRKTLYDFRA